MSTEWQYTKMMLFPAYATSMRHILHQACANNNGGDTIAKFLS